MRSKVEKKYIKYLDTEKWEPRLSNLNWTPSKGLKQ